MSDRTGTRVFAPFEWMLSLRYLRSRRKEGFISVIAGFSFLGIMLGVATLIIVMAVMNGFRKELLDKILGSTATCWCSRWNLRSPTGKPLPIASRKCPASARRADRGRAGARVLAVQFDRRAGARHPLGRPDKLTRSPTTSSRGTLDGFDTGQGLAIGRRMSPISFRCAPATTSRWWRRAAR
jgi:lipoprotein-releasing system permease protein